jgi:glycosyltransferase involved in cell wall biosynthesis
MTSSVSKPRILVLLGCYLPGFRSGGPVRTISCMVEALAPFFDFRIVTLNHDSGSTEIYDSVQTHAWNQVGSAQVYYIPNWSVALVQRIAKEVEPHLIYLNGFFATSSIYGLLARNLGKLPDVPFILATRGDLAGGALGLKTPKKRAYMAFARLFNLYKDLRWHASSEREKSEMLSQLQSFGLSSDQVLVAPDLGSGYASVATPRPQKLSGIARFVTLSRITRMKNLPFTLDRLAELHGDVSLDIFGPVEDRELWSECERKLAALPKNVTVNYKGAVEPDRVLGEMSQRHFFILPTLGENYGHVIIEAAASGCPVIISDRTQWSGLEQKNVGWDISLDDPSRWRSLLQSCVDMSEEQYESMAESASRFGRAVMESRENLEANVDLFRRAIHERTPPLAEALSRGSVR